MDNKAKILICIAFHYNQSRIGYLQRVISSYLQFNDYDIDIILDTNSDESTTAVAELPLPAGKTLTIKQWTLSELDNDPFRLTWTHRQHIAAKSEQYDYYVYTEDDILLPYENFLFWTQQEVELWQQDLLPGFLRVEQHPDYPLVSVDNATTTGKPEIVNIGKHKYVRNLSPYAALWILTKQGLQKFLLDSQWHTGYLGYPHYPVREKVAIGYAWKKLPAGDHKHRMALAMNKGMQIDPRAFVYHLPNNYANNTNLFSGQYGSLPVEFVIPDADLFPQSEHIARWASKISEEYLNLQKQYVQATQFLEQEQSIRAELSKLLEESSQNISALYQSQSWKITRPLRLAARIKRGDWRAISRTLVSTYNKPQNMPAVPTPGENQIH